MKDYEEKEIAKMISTAVDKCDKARRSESVMLLKEINKLRDRLCSEHEYEFLSKENIDVHEDGFWYATVAFRFFCTKCSHFKLLSLAELDDEWVKLIIQKDIEIYKDYIQEKYEENRNIKESYKIKGNKLC